MEDKFMPDEKTSGDQAEFNNAFAFLERLNKIEYLIEDNLMTWRLKEVYSCLESYENELEFSFKERKGKVESDQERIDNIKGEINKIYNNHPTTGEIGRDGANKPFVIGANYLGQIRSKLIELNKVLRRIKYASGMGMPKKGYGKMF